MDRLSNIENMNMTAKDLDEIGKKTAKWEAALLSLVRLTQPVARLLFRIGFIRRAHARSNPGRVGIISRLAARGEHEQAADLAIQGLHHCRRQTPGRFWPGGQYNWWFFMALAGESLGRVATEERCDELIEMAKDGVEPFEGYLVARAYLAFARWKYRVQNYDAAIEFAEAAVRADDTWAQADYELGWYCLATGRDDAMHHLGRAVTKDPQIVSRIDDDPIWRQRPEALEKLRELSAEQIAGAQDKAAAEDDGPAG